MKSARNAAQMPSKIQRRRPVKALETAQQTHRFTVSTEDVGRRLDSYLAAQFPELSRTRIQQLIDAGRVRVGKLPPRRSQAVAAGDEIQIDVQPREPLAAQAEEIPLELLYEDDDFVVVNKPAGMVVHAGAGITRGTMVNALLHRLGTLATAGGEVRPGIVHRLDRGTSGAVVVARNDFAHQSLSEQFAARTVHKTYVALVAGRLGRVAGTIDLPITRDPRRRTRMTARLPKGRESRTDWRVLLRVGNFHGGGSGAAHGPDTSNPRTFCRGGIPADRRHALRRSAGDPRGPHAAAAARSRVSARRSITVCPSTNGRKRGGSRAAGIWTARLPVTAGGRGANAGSRGTGGIARLFVMSVAAAGN